MYSERTIANAFNKRFVGPLAGLLDSAGASVVFMCNEFTKRTFNSSAASSIPIDSIPILHIDITESFTLSELRTRRKRRLLAWTIFHHAYYKILQTLLLAF